MGALGCHLSELAQPGRDPVLSEAAAPLPLGASPSLLPSRAAGGDPSPTSSRLCHLGHAEPRCPHLENGHVPVLAPHSSGAWKSWSEVPQAGSL